MFYMLMLRIKDKDVLSETIIRILIEVERRVRDCLSEFMIFHIFIVIPAAPKSSRLCF